MSALRRLWPDSLFRRLLLVQALLVLAAAGIGIGAMVLVAIFSALPTIGSWAPGNLGDPAMALALGSPVHGLLPPLASTILLVVVAYALAWLSFRRQEL